MSGRLIVIGGPDQGLELAVPPAGGTVGRGSSCALRLTDPAISREHARLAVGDGGVTIEVVGATNPTRVNGQPVTSRRLAPGDVIAIGETLLQWLPDDGGVAVYPTMGATRVTVELSGARDGAAAAGPATRAVASLCAQLAAADGAAAAAAALAAAVLDALRARGALVLVRDPAGFLAPAGRAGDHPGAVRVDQQVIDRVASGDALVLGDARRELVAPVGAGLLHVDGGPGRPWADAELALAAALAACAGLALEGLAARALIERRARALDERAGPVPVRGASAAARALDEFVVRVAAADATVLLRGESGSGKEVAAAAIHRRSRRGAGPFVAVSCATLGEALIESELFGHERGAFTGAVERRVGRFEQADGGTLFLDEIAELSARCQAKLLRVLEERRFERLGGTKTIAVDVRVIAATHRDLRAMVADGTFRDDLYYRLGVLVGTVPPLRERTDDLPALALHLLATATARLGRRVGGFAPDALRALAAHPWPGNVRELRNVIERIVVLGDADPATAADVARALGADARTAAPIAAPAAAPAAAAASSENRTLIDLEKDAIVATLAAHGGNKARAAAALGIDRTALYKKLRRFGLG